MSPVEFIGWAGAISLTLCGLPQLFKICRTKKVEGLSLFMLLLCGTGMLLMTIYVFLTSQQLPLLVNYGFNVFVVTAILYKYFQYRQ